MERKIYRVIGVRATIWIVERETPKCLFLRKKDGSVFDTYRLPKSQLNKADWGGDGFFELPGKAWDNIHKARAEEIAAHLKTLEAFDASVLMLLETGQIPAAKDNG